MPTPTIMTLPQLRGMIDREVREAFGRREIREVFDQAARKAARDDDRRQALYDRVSRLTGSFEYEGKSLQEIARAAAERLGLKLDGSADPVSTVEGYVAGRQAQRAAADAADPQTRFWRGLPEPKGNSIIDKYLGNAA